jgi:hypothetical protein
MDTEEEDNKRFSTGVMNYAMANYYEDFHVLLFIVHMNFVTFVVAIGCLKKCNSTNHIWRECSQIITKW